MGDLVELPALRTAGVRWRPRRSHIGSVVASVTWRRGAAGLVAECRVPQGVDRGALAAALRDLSNILSTPNESRG